MVAILRTKNKSLSVVKLIFLQINIENNESLLLFLFTLRFSYLHEVKIILILAIYDDFFFN